MKRTKLLAVLASVTLVGGVLAGCGGSPDASSAGGSDLKTVRVAFTPGATTLPVHIAQTRGIFKKNGIDFKGTEGLDLPTWAAGLGKQWDVAMTTPGIFLKAAGKLDLVVVAGAQVTTKDSLAGNPLITRDPSIKDAVDLVGKRVGVATLTGSTANSIRYLVKKQGGDPDKVKLVQVPFDAAGNQLKAGQLDAVVSAIPFSVKILDDSKNKALFDVQDKALRDLAPNQDVMASILFTSKRSWAKQNPVVAAAYEKSLQEADEWINANKKEALAELSKWLGISLDILNKMPWPIPVEANITRASLQPSVDLFVAVGALSKDQAPDLSGRFPNE